MSFDTDEDFACYAEAEAEAQAEEKQRNIDIKLSEVMDKISKSLQFYEQTKDVLLNSEVKQAEATLHCAELDFEAAELYFQKDVRAFQNLKDATYTKASAFIELALAKIKVAIATDDEIMLIKAEYDVRKALNAYLYFDRKDECLYSCPPYKEMECIFPLVSNFEKTIGNYYMAKAKANSEDTFNMIKYELSNATVKYDEKNALKYTSYRMSTITEYIDFVTICKNKVSQMDKKAKFGMQLALIDYKLAEASHCDLDKASLAFEAAFDAAQNM